MQQFAPPPITNFSGQNRHFCPSAEGENGSVNEDGCHGQALRLGLVVLSLNNREEDQAMNKALNKPTQFSPSARASNSAKLLPLVKGEVAGLPGRRGLSQTSANAEKSAPARAKQTQLWKNPPLTNMKICEICVICGFFPSRFASFPRRFWSFACRFWSFLVGIFTDKTPQKPHYKPKNNEIPMQRLFSSNVYLPLSTFLRIAPKRLHCSGRLCYNESDHLYCKISQNRR